MHPRNPYKTPPDFLALAESYPPLKPHVFFVSGHPSIDFKSVAAQRRLTEAILYQDFGLSLELPDGRLCPPVPNRLNYILWLQDIVGSRIAQGIDIGTGASAIYPLLGCTLEPNWSFIGTEIDPLSFQSAARNVQSNNLQAKIHLLLANTGNCILIPLFDNLIGRVDFIMCNPPFYSSLEDVQQSAASKEFSPNAVCTAADIEMITPGGEAAFVKKMVNESLITRLRCRWYTSLLGKMSSVADIVTVLRENSIDNYGITEFIQGQTRRWAIAWSFGEIRLRDEVGRNCSESLRSYLPPHTTLRQPFAAELSFEQLYSTLKIVLSSIAGLEVNLGPPVRITANAVTWTRSARRKVSSEPKMAAGVILECQIEASRSQKGLPILEVNWLWGRDPAVFESFWSHITRKIARTVESCP